MSTYIHGIGASENIDTSGEIVSIAGLDISSLDKDGVFNWEHKSDQPSQVVGKILKARKIFSDADCEDEYQEYFWNKCKVPFLYVMGELTDDYTDSAREVAGKFRYDADKKAQNERSMMNFSVEGSKISKEGITVTRSIARKITITILPCNKAAVAEMVATAPGSPKKSAIDELFKTEAVEIEVLNIDSKSKLWDLLKKEDPSKHAAKLGIKPFGKNTYGGQSPDNQMGSAIGGTGGPSSAGGLLNSEKMAKAAPKLPAAIPKPHERGSQIGLTGAGHGVFSHGMVGDYSHFSHKDHHEAASAHQKVSNASTDPKVKMHHANKAKLHTARGHSVEAAGKDRAQRAANLKTTASTATPNLGTSNKLHHPDLSGTSKPPGPVKKTEMNKAITAGSGLAAPDRLTGGAALGKEELEKAGTSGMDPQSGNDPGASRINKPLRSKDSRVQVLAPHISVGKSEDLRKDAANPKLAPKDHKIKQLQTQIDSGAYKPDASKIGTAMLGHPEKPLKGTKVQKSEWLQRAESEYASWNKREQFEQFMQKRLPNLTRSEIQVIGQTMLLQKSLKQEKLLKDFYNPSGGSVLGKSKKIK